MSILSFRKILSAAPRLLKLLTGCCQGKRKELNGEIVWQTQIPLCAAFPDSDTFLQETSILNLKTPYLGAQGTILPPSPPRALALYLSKNVIPIQGDSFALQNRAISPIFSIHIHGKCSRSDL